MATANFYPVLIVRLAASILVLSTFASVTGAEVTVSLSVAPRQDEAIFPFRKAELAIDYSQPARQEVVQAVSIRWTEGGPTLLYQTAIAPGTRETLSVELPAMAVQQAYEIRLLSGKGPSSGVLQRRQVAVSWPPELVTADEFFAPQAYQKYEFDLPTWPGQLKRNVFLAAVLIGLAMAAALFIRSGPVRAEGLVVIVVGAAATMAMMVLAQGLVQRRSDGGMLVLSARRTVQWEQQADRLFPIYTHYNLAGDSLVIQPQRNRLSLELRPREVRLLGRMGQSGGAPTTMPADVVVQPPGT